MPKRARKQRSASADSDVEIVFPGTPTTKRSRLTDTLQTSRRVTRSSTIMVSQKKHLVIPATTTTDLRLARMAQKAAAARPNLVADAAAESPGDAADEDVTDSGSDYTEHIEEVARQQEIADQDDRGDQGETCERANSRILRRRQRLRLVVCMAR